MHDLYIYLGIYTMLIFGISFWASRRNSSEDFLIAGRNRGMWQLLASKFATSIGIAYFITYGAYAYQFGLSTLSLIPGFFIAYLLFALWAGPRIHKYSREGKFYTQGDFVAHQLGRSSTKIVTDNISIVNSALWMLVSFIGGSKVISYISPLSYEVSLAVVALVILAYVLLSGFRAVMLTDILQALIIIIVLCLSIIFLFGQTSVPQILASAPADNITVVLIIGLFVYGIFSIFSSPDRYQLCFAARDAQAIKKGLSYAFIPLIIAMVLIVLVGLFMYGQNPTLDPDIAFVEFFLSHIPQYAVGLGGVLLIAGLMSTADTHIYVVASYQGFLKKRQNMVGHIRRNIILLVAFLCGVSYFVRDVVEVTIFAAGFSIVISVAMLYVIAGGVHARKFYASVTGGFMGFVLGLMIWGLDPSIAIMPIIGGALGLLWPVKKKIKEVE